MQHAVCHLVGRGSSAIKFDRAEITLFFFLKFDFVHRNNFPMKEGRKLEYPEKTLKNKLQKMPHSKGRKFKPQAWLESTL